MDVSDLRIAMFSGNYNYVRDGANQALNRLVDYLLRKGASVRIYSPTIDNPAFPAIGEVVSVKSIALPGGRSEYRAALGLPGPTRKDILAFKPNIMHIASPEFLGHRALTFGRRQGLPVLASMHTRFETYPRYYGLAFLEPIMLILLRRFYRRCDAVVAPSESMAQVMREQRLSYDIGIWTRGIDTTIFNAGQRDLSWRRSLGIGDQDVVIAFFGRLVMEKGLDVFSDTIDTLKARGVAHRVLVIGDGPAHDWFQKRLPDAIFVGFQAGAALGRAVASADVLFNPSVTETFGNVTLEVMASRLPVLAARATGSSSLVKDGITGRLVRPGAINSFAEALEAYCTDPALRQAHGCAGEAESLRYDWDRVNQAVIDTYLRLIRQRNGHRG
jgi:phosphatidylinositol alpha 1,6-mannosyltransferase